VSAAPKCDEGDGHEGGLHQRLGLPLVVAGGDGKCQEGERSQQKPDRADPRPSAQTDASGECQNDDGREGEHDEALRITGEEQLSEDQREKCEKRRASCLLVAAPTTASPPIRRPKAESALVTVGASAVTLADRVSESTGENEYDGRRFAFSQMTSGNDRR
jgi:hypothetical protein